MQITLQQIRDKSPCREGWLKLLKTLGTDDMSTTVSIGQIARSNGPQDALWCLRCAEFDRRDIIRCVLPAVKRASIHTTDKRVHDCIATIDVWLDGNATDAELQSTAVYAADAADAADAAADAAVYAAVYAAAYTAYTADAAAYTADAAAYTADAAVYAAAYTADAAAYAAAYAAAELQQQINDICVVFP